MRFDKKRQWVGAVYAEDIEPMKDMLAEDPSLADSSHEAFDDPFREGRFPVATLTFAVNGPHQQVVNWRKVERKINFNMVKLLVEAGADPNIDSAHGLPLCLTRDERMAKYLIDNGGDINRWYGNGGAPIYFSMWSVDVERLKMQLRLGADPYQMNPENGASLLHGIAEITPDEIQDQVEFIRMIADTGVDVNHKAGIGVQSDSGPIYQADTPLHMAAARNNAAVIQALLDVGCDPTLTNARDETPLAVARRENRGDEIIALLAVSNHL